MIRLIYSSLLFLGVLLSLFFPGQTLLFASEARLDLGAGPLTVAGNHYRGSDQSKIWVFPIPYFSYKSEKLEAEPSFIRGILFHNRWLAFKLSLVPGLNVESKDNQARAGMPSLDYSIEVGPMAIVRLWESGDQEVRINFEMPVRESFALSFKKIKPAGMVTVPYVNVIYNPRKENWNFDSEFSVSPMFASERYHQRFYSVASEFQTSTRPAYQAQGGYSGLQTAIVFNKRFHDLGILSFVRWDQLKGAAFRKSPLVKQQNYYLGGLGLFWMFN